MNTVQLKYFIAVAETLSFTQAARELFVAQTAISQQIASLERELDVTLFTPFTLEYEKYRFAEGDGDVYLPEYEKTPGHPLLIRADAVQAKISGNWAYAEHRG